MSKNRQLVSDIQELDKGLTECENFLTKVLNRQSEISRQIPANKKKNVPPKSVSRPQSGGTQKYQRPPSAGASSIKDSSKMVQSTRKNVPTAPAFSKRVSPERLSRPKNIEPGQRRRSSSVSRIGSQACRCEPIKPESSNKIPFHVRVPNVSNANAPQEQFFVKPEVPSGAKCRSPELSKHLSWGEILRENRSACSKRDKGQWDIGGFHPQSTRPAPPPTRPFYSTKQPHECEPVKEYCSQSSECTAGAPCNHFFKVSIARRAPDESFSSEGTSGFSSNNDLPSNLTNKSIQCGSPIASVKPKPSVAQHYDHRRVSSSSSSGASSQKEEKEKVVDALGSDVFTMFNPVRTLNFLIKELQGMVQKHPKEDASISRIIANMEKVLLRLPEEAESAETTSGYTTHSKQQDSHSLTSASTHSYNVVEKPIGSDAQRAAIVRTLQSVPVLARQIDERMDSMRKKIVEAKTCVSVPSFTPTPPEMILDNVENILQLQRYIETSGHQLEILCQTMEKTCDVLQKQRDSLQGELEERDKKLKIVKSQEQDFVTTVASLRTNLETASRRVTQLSVENKLLKEQVKNLPVLHACQAELKIMTEKLAQLEAESKELPALKYVEEKYKELSAENVKLKEENKIIPVLRAKEIKVAELTSELATLGVQKKNLEETVARNNQEIKKLKGEIQNPVAVTEATRRLTQRLQDTMKERDDAQHDVQMLRIEREKLLVLKQNKDEELSHFVKDILNIKKMVTEQLGVLKMNIPKMLIESISDVMSSGSDSDEVTSVESRFRPVCSSPTSSAAPPIDDVWQDMSTIVPEHTQSSPEILVGADRKKMVDSVSPPTKFQDLAPDTWHSEPTVMQGDPKDDPLPPSTANPGKRLPKDQNVMGDNQWVGAAAVTQELQQNVEELFKLIKNGSKLVVNSSDVLSTRGPLSSLSSVPSSRPVQPGKSGATRKRSIPFQMPNLPDPPKFLDFPEFSDFSSYHGSLGDTSSVESIDVMLKELQKDEPKQE